MRALSRAAVISLDGGPPPHEQLRISDLFHAQFIASAISSVEPKPEVIPTYGMKTAASGDMLIGSIFILLATPLIPRLLFDAAIIPAQAVPCDLLFHEFSFCGSPKPFLFLIVYPGKILPPKSSWLRSTPLSITATVMSGFPLVNCHAGSTLISTPLVPPFCPVFLR